MNKKIIISLSLLFLNSSCQFFSRNELEKPNTLSADAIRSPQSISQVEDELKNFEDLVSSSQLNSSNCSSLIDPALEHFDRLDPSIIKLGDQDKTKVRTKLTEWLKRIFQARVNLRSRVEQLSLNGSNKSCLRSIRRALVFARQAEEILLVFGKDNQFFIWNDDDEYAFWDKFPLTMVNPKFSKLEIKSGDVFLDRGDSALSAQIARIGDVEHVFSHSMIVGEDPKGNLYIIETTVQDIVGIIPLKKYLKENTDTRMAIFRHPDANLAKKAGRFIYDYVHKNKSSILYDFHMNDQNPKEMFCSEVAQFAYRNVSNGKLVLPKYKTEVSRFNVMGSKNWVKAMGINYDKIFSPSDMDVETRFELVAEYRNIDEIEERRIDDAVMTSMYDWMLDLGYYFPLDLRDQGLANIGVLKARLFGDSLISKNMPKAAVTASLEFERVFDFIRENLDPVTKAYHKQYGTMMPTRKMLQVNNQLRESDCERLKSYRQALQPADDLTQEKPDFLNQMFISKTACKY